MSAWARDNPDTPELQPILADRADEMRDDIEPPVNMWGASK